MAKCPYYNKYTWVEPPLEPGDNDILDGTPYTAYECENAKGYFVASYCSGKKELCNLPAKHVKKWESWIPKIKELNDEK